MKTVKLEVVTEIAKRVLGEYEKLLSEKIQIREQVSEEITSLEENVKSLRLQLQNGNGDALRSRTGENKAKIISYLQSIPGNRGAKISDILKATGVVTSSIYATITSEKNQAEFKKDGKLWKLAS